ncbi:MAG: hypothetical protein AAFP08_16340, partial [Bacteroidota bacterium]
MATLIDGTSAGRTHSSNGVDPRTTAGSRSSGIRGLYRMPTSSRELLQSELRDDNLMSGGFAPALPQTLFFNCDDSGNIYEVLIVATDQSGNMDTTTIQVTILDTIPPVITCEDIDVFLDADGAAVIENDDAIISITDNCTDSLDLT